MSVQLSRDLLVDLGGWEVLKEARALVERGCVREAVWEGSMLRGVVDTGGRVLRPAIDLAKAPFAEPRCGCVQGRGGMVCAHVIGICLKAMEVESKVGDVIEKSLGAPGDDFLPVGREPKSLVLSREKGLALSFRVYLPPNLGRALQTGRAVVRLDAVMSGGRTIPPEKLDRGRAYALSVSHAKLAAMVEGWCGGRLAGLLQLDSGQLRQLLDGFRGEAAVFWMNRVEEAIPWRGDVLEGVHVWLSSFEGASSESSIQVDSNGKAAPGGKVGLGRDHGLQLPLFPEENNPSARPVSGPEVRLGWEIEGSFVYLSARLPDPSDPRHRALRELLGDEGFRVDPSNGRWWLRDEHKVLNFLADQWHRLFGEPKGGPEKGPAFRKHFSRVELAGVRAKTVEFGGQIELEVSLDIDAPEAELRRQLEQGRRYWKGGGRLVLIPGETLGKLGRFRQAILGSAGGDGTMRMKVAPRQMADIEQVLDSAGIGWEPPESWRARTEGLRRLNALREAPVGKVLDSTLRGYQRLGVAWMFHLYQAGLGGLLADEMGLGKTLQAIGLVQAVRTLREGMALVVCPAGLTTNWEREVGRFAPELKVRLHHGTARGKGVEDFLGVDLVITSYSTLVRDLDWIGTLDYALVIADEAQHIKNRSTRHAVALKSLVTGGRFLLTGTPVENRIEDLVSLFEFLMPGYLLAAPKGGGLAERDWYVGRVREQASPYILRRTKAKVAPELPPKIDQVIYCRMDERQAALYEAMRVAGEKSLVEMEWQEVSEARLRMAALTELLRLRQFCADPRLVDTSLEGVGSAKMDAFLEILEECMDDGHRILVFSQFVSLLTLLRETLDQRGVAYCYLDGSTRDRLGEADRFNNDLEIPVFLISLKAGGVGLNLTGADTVVHFDPWWNPAAEAQATDRAHRIGQNRVVTNIRLVVADSVEERVQAMQEQKRALLRDLFEASEAQTGRLTLADMRDLLT